MILDTKISQAIEIYEEAQYHPARIVALYSGGHDSVVATHLVHEYCITKQPDWTVHINTGIQVVAEPEQEIPSPEEWVTWMANRQGWNLKVYRAMEHRQAPTEEYPEGKPDPQDYLEIAKKYDFPGPASHGMMYARLKERPIQRLCRDARAAVGIAKSTKYWKDEHGRHEFRVMLVAGCRSQESVRRMGTTQKIQRQGVRLWVNPIADFTNEDVRDYIRRHKLPESPIANLIHKSGECLCGAFAHPGELKEYEMLLPRTAAMIHRLQEHVRAAGHKGNWGCRPYKGRKRLETPGPLCQGCVFWNFSPTGAQL